MMIVHLLLLTIGTAAVTCGWFFPTFWSPLLLVVGSAAMTIGIFGIFDAKTNRSNGH